MTAWLWQGILLLPTSHQTKGMLVWVDDRFEYAEARMIALAPKTQTLYYVAFVDRGEAEELSVCAGPIVEIPRKGYAESLLYGLPSTARR